MKNKFLVKFKDQNSILPNVLIFLQLYEIVFSRSDVPNPFL